MRVMHHVLLVTVALLVLIPSALPAQVCYTTLDDGVWGNPHRDFNGVQIPALVDSLIPVGDPLIIGLPGRSVAFEDGGEPCIVAGLPGGGRPSALTGDFVDAVVDTDCVLPEGFPANRKGKFRNALLGETVALSLNCRLDVDLCDLVVSSVMMTVPALPGEDGLYGTEDDSLCADCDTMTVRMPDDLMAVLEDTMGVVPSVGAVLGLANTALAGGETYGLRGKTVWQAVSNINRAFKRTRYLVADEPDTIIPILLASPGFGTEGRGGEGAPTDPVEEPARLAAAPSAVVLSLPQSARATVVAYNVAGREVAVLADRVFPGGRTLLEIPAGHRVPSGVYFVRADVELPSGASRLSTKMVVLR